MAESMKAISLHQPPASLCVTRQPCDCKAQQSTGMLALAHEQPGCSSWSMVKRFETRSWPCPPKLIGSRILIHATQRKPESGLKVGDYRVSRARAPKNSPFKLWAEAHHLRHTCVELPLGAIVGSATIEACYPIVGTGSEVTDKRVYVAPLGTLAPMHGGGDSTGEDWDEEWTDISDQLPYGDYRPGRYAWLLTDAAPTNDRCPACDGSGLVSSYILGVPADCRVCRGAGHCDPIPAKGRQRIWNWTPA